MQVKDIVMWLSLVGLIIMSSMYGCERNKKIEAETLLTTVGDSLTTYKNKYGEQVAKTSLIQGQNVSLFLSLVTKDSTTKALQSLVKKYEKELKNGGTATVVENVTNLEVTNVIDTTYISDLTPGFILEDSVNNNWIDLTYGFIFKEDFTDSSFASLEVRNAYSFVTGEERTGFLGLGKRKPFVEITNHNPYTQTKNLKSFEVTESRKKRWVIGPQLGVTINQSFNLSPTVGAGITYNLISF